MSTISTPAPAPSVPDITPLVESARLAQKDWSEGFPLRARLRCVRAFRHLLVEHADDLARALQRDVGKSPEEALGGDILPTADACRFLERRAEKVLRPRRVRRSDRPLWLFGQSDTVYRRPRGVVGIIGTWNYPLFLNAIQIVQAVVAGNAVVWKPSEVAPALAGVLADLLGRAGFLPGLVQVLPATREMGPVLLESAIDHVVFTGAASTGRKIAARLGERLISSTLELSGCDAQFVLPDADVTLAARAAWFGSTVNRGQTCIAVRRSLVHRSLYPAFCASLQELAQAGTPLPLALPAQVKETEALVQDAVDRGGKLLVEGPVADSQGGCRPAVVADADPEMALCRQAAFGPVMAVLPFDDLDEAVRLESRCPYALGASIFTRSATSAQRLAAQLRAGVVTVNDVVAPTAHPATPFGGRAQSGWGVTQGEEGLLEMTVPQVVSVKGGTFRPHYDMAPGRGAGSQEELLRALLQASHAPTLARRLAGWWRVVRAAWRRS